MTRLSNMSRFKIRNSNNKVIRFSIYSNNKKFIKKSKVI